MALSWSHSVLLVKDEDRMLDFYTNALGFQVTDRGSVGENREIVFLSQQPDEHHQIGLVLNNRDDVGPSPNLAHLAFRVESMGELRDVIERLKARDVALRPTSHGSTWSVYFQDPEQNGIEIFYDTPWHVQQPQGKTWDLEMDDESLMAWTKANFEQEADFRPRQDYIERRKKALGRV